MCRMDLNLLQDYIDNSLEPLEKVVLEEHLRVCPACRRELNHLKIVDWDTNRFFDEEATGPVPDELRVIRDASFRLFIEQERKERDHALSPVEATEDSGGRVGLKEVLSLQVSNLNNSLKFVSLLAAANPSAKSKKPVSKTAGKKKSLFRKIIGV